MPVARSAEIEIPAYSFYSQATPPELGIPGKLILSHDTTLLETLERHGHIVWKPGDSLAESLSSFRIEALPGERDGRDVYHTNELLMEVSPGQLIELAAFTPYHKLPHESDRATGKVLHAIAEQIAVTSAAELRMRSGIKTSPGDIIVCSPTGTTPPYPAIESVDRWGRTHILTTTENGLVWNLVFTPHGVLTEATLTDDGTAVDIHYINAKTDGSDTVWATPSFGEPSRSTRYVLAYSPEHPDDAAIVSVKESTPLFTDQKSEMDAYIQMILTTLLKNGWHTDQEVISRLVPYQVFTTAGGKRELPVFIVGERNNAQETHQYAAFSLTDHPSQLRLDGTIVGFIMQGDESERYQPVHIDSGRIGLIGLKNSKFPRKFEIPTTGTIHAHRSDNGQLFLFPHLKLFSPTGEPVQALYVTESKPWRPW